MLEQSLYQLALFGFRQFEGLFTLFLSESYLARTHLDLAALAHAQGDTRGAETHLASARDLFGALGIPKYVERVGQLASAYFQK